MADIVLSNRDLLLSYEGIGGNCEFGVVQRCCGVEPLGLFRFSGSDIVNLTDCINTRLDHLFKEGYINIFEEPRTDEYMYTFFHYNDFPNHTEISLVNADIENIAKRIQRKVDFLKQRFVEDLDSGEKIFLRTGRECRQKILALHDALRTVGPNRLLWVLEADEEHPAGSIEVIRAGLAIGYIGYFKDFAKDQPVDLANWLMVLKRVYRALPSERHRNATAFEANTSVETSSEWLAHPRAAVVPMSPRTRAASADTMVTAFQLRADAGAADAWALCEIDHGLAPRTTVVFSAWILIPEGYRGSRICVYAKTDVYFSSMADLTIRNRWQRLWAIARLPKARALFCPYVMANGLERDLLVLSEWSLETGICPSDPIGGAPRPRGRATSMRPVIYEWANRLFPHVGDRIANASGFWSSAVQIIRRSIAEGRFTEADELCRACLARFPGDPILLEHYATSAHNRGRHLSAIARWEAALAASPDDPMCSAGLACNLREVGEVGRAVEIVTRALSRHGDDVVLSSEAARVFQGAGHHDLALAQWDKVLALPDTHPDWACSRIAVLMALGRFDEARAACKTADLRHAGHPGLRKLALDLDHIRSEAASAG